MSLGPDGKVRGMKRVILTLAACVVALCIAGCAGGGSSVYEIIPGVPFPATYQIAITPDGYDAALPAVHYLSIVEPTVSSGHSFEFTISPVGSLTTAGAIEVSTARSPGTIPQVRGRSVSLSVDSTEYASAAQFVGVVGYENTGAVLADSGTVKANFWTDEQTGARLVHGTFNLTTVNPAITPLFRSYKGTFDGELTGDDGDGGESGGGPPDPPY
jgi:hypothetical protein